MSDPESELRVIRGRALAGVLRVGVRNVVVRIIGLAGAVVIARLLDPADFGLLSLGLSLQLLGNVLASGGLGADLVRREAEPTRHELEAALGLQVAIALGVVALISLLAFFVGEDAWVIALISVAVPVALASSPSRVHLQRALDWNLIAFAEVAGALCFNVAAIGLVVAGLGVWGVAAATVAEAAVVSGLLVIRGPVGLYRPRIDIPVVKPMLRFGLAYQLMALVDRGRDQAVNLLAAGIGGLALLGIWSAAFRIFLAINLVFEALWRVGFPAMSRLLQAGQDAAQMVQATLRLNVVAIGFPAVAVAGTAPALVPLLFGSAFEDAASVLPWGAAALMLTGPMVTAGLSFIQAKGDAPGMVRSYAAQTVVWLAAGAVLIELFGVEGVGMSMLLGAFALVASVKLSTEKHVDMRLLDAFALPLAFAAAASAAAWFIAEEVEPLALGFAASLIVAEAAFFGLLLALRRSDLTALVRTARFAISPPAAPAPAPAPEPVPAADPGP